MLSVGAVGSVEGSVGSTLAVEVGVAVAVVEVMKPDRVEVQGFLVLLLGLPGSAEVELVYMPLGSGAAAVGATAAVDDASPVGVAP